MRKRSVKAKQSSFASNKQEIKVQSPRALGEQVLLAMGLERKDSADLWVYKDSRGGVYVTQEPREGIRRIQFVSRKKES